QNQYDQYDQHANMSQNYTVNLPQQSQANVRVDLMTQEDYYDLEYEFEYKPRCPNVDVCHVCRLVYLGIAQPLGIAFCLTFVGLGKAVLSVMNPIMLIMELVTSVTGLFKPLISSSPCGRVGQAFGLFRRAVRCRGNGNDVLLTLHLHDLTAGMLGLTLCGFFTGWTVTSLEDFPSHSVALSWKITLLILVGYIIGTNGWVLGTCLVLKWIPQGIHTFSAQIRSIDDQSSISWIKL